MAQGIQITIDTAMLDKIRDGLGIRANMLLDKAAHDIEGDAKEMAPVDTGALRNSIHVESGNLERTIADAVEYGVYVEMGTSRMGARPFLMPSFERNRRPFLEAWRQLFK